jgi:hypothetical protein
MMHHDIKAYRGLEAELHAYLTLALGQLHAHTTELPKKKTLITL